MADAPIWPVEAGNPGREGVTHEFAAFAGPSHPRIPEGDFCLSVWVIGRAAFELERDIFRRLRAEGYYGWVLVKVGYDVTPMEPPKMRKGKRK